MFPPDDVRPSERLKAGSGNPDRCWTSRVTEGVSLHHPAPLIQPPYRRLQLLRREQPGGKAEKLKVES
jgi:hypothetical protein